MLSTSLSATGERVTQAVSVSIGCKTLAAESAMYTASAAAQDILHYKDDDADRLSRQET
jgi:hypothetical protein